MKIAFTFIFIFIFFSLLGKCLYAQSPPLQIGLQAGSGLEAGWWIYQHGPDGDGQTGWDRTHLSLVFPAILSLEIRASRFSFGGGIQYKLLNDDVMIASDNRRGNRRRYAIADKDKPVPVTCYFVKASYPIFQSETFRLAPQLKLGVFTLKTLHPRAIDFGFKGFLEWGFVSHIRIHRLMELNVSPVYSLFFIHQKHPINAQERHRIYSVGAHIGVTRWFWK